MSAPPNQRTSRSPVTAVKLEKGEGCVHKVVDLWDPKETIYTGQTGAFPITAQSGARYVMVIVTIDSNVILVCPIKNRTDQELTKAYKILLRRAKATWISSKKHVLDNECSK